MAEYVTVEPGLDLRFGDCLAVLRTLPDASVDAIVTDPPYGLADHKPAQVTAAVVAWASGDREVVPSGRGFMGRDWDAFVPPPAVWDECLRVLKPGGHLVAFAGSRTYDLMGLSIRMAGFEIRDGLSWVYGSGFPKSLDVSKAIDKAAGAEREVIGERARPDGSSRCAEIGGVAGNSLAGSADGSLNTNGAMAAITAPATPEAAAWAGWGTALKPAQEPIVLARKPLVGTVAGNVLAHGTGGLNVDACRTAGAKPDTTRGASVNASSMAGELGGQGRILDDGRGRWPANVLLSHGEACADECVPGCPVAELDAQSGKVGAAAPVRGTEPSAAVEPGTITGTRARVPGAFHNDQGGASRFFPAFRYQAKAPGRERPKIDGQGHPTVKPLALMEWVVRLVTPPGGTVLDPFAGTGTTLDAARRQGFASIGVERWDLAYRLACQRLGLPDVLPEPVLDEPAPLAAVSAPVEPPAPVDPILAAIASAGDEQAALDLWRSHASEWTEAHTEAVRARLPELRAAS